MALTQDAAYCLIPFVVQHIADLKMKKDHQASVVDELQLKIQQRKELIVSIDHKGMRNGGTTAKEAFEIYLHNNSISTYKLEIQSRISISETLEHSITEQNNYLKHLKSVCNWVDPVEKENELMESLKE